MNAEPRCLAAINAQERALFFPHAATRPFDGLLPHVRYVETPVAPDEWASLLATFDPEVVITCWQAPLISSRSQSLKYVCHVAGSVRDHVPRALIEQGLLVTNWGESAAGSVAEAALMLTLSALRRSHDVARIMHIDRGWDSAKGGMRSLYGRRVGLHGFGAVARRLVALLQPFRPVLYAYSAGVPDTCFAELGVARCHTLRELFSSVEILIEAEALNAHTRHSVGAELLALLPDDAVFVNVGRGPVVEESALLAFAQDPRKRVALDVYAEEPLPPDSPLRGLPNVILFPHVAGPTLDSFPECGAFAQRNLQRYRSGSPLEAIVTPAIYDRAT